MGSEDMRAVSAEPAEFGTTGYSLPTELLDARKLSVQAMMETEVGPAQTCLTLEDCEEPSGSPKRLIFEASNRTLRNELPNQAESPNDPHRRPAA